MTLSTISLIKGLRTHAAAASHRFPVLFVGKAAANKLLPVLLGSVAGSTDTIGFLAFGIFPAHITGNFVLMAAHLVTHGKVSLSVILSVPVFVAAIFMTRWLMAWLTGLGIGLLQPLITLECLLLGGFLAMGGGIRGPVHFDTLATTFAGMLGVAAMAVQNVVGQVSLGAVSTTAMTANVARFALDASEIMVSRTHHDWNWWQNRLPQAGPLAGFVIGCGLGAACEVAFDLRALVLPLALALLSLAISFATASKTRGLV